MYRKAILVAALVATCWLAHAERQGRETVSIFGPRIGATYVVVPSEDFDESMRDSFGDMERSYFPLFTQFGLHFEQRIRLGQTRSHFVFQEVLLLGGLDQNATLPSASVLIGFRSAQGLEFGLGTSMARVDDEEKIGLSVVYGIGWTFSFEDVHVPVNLAIVPTPRDGHPRFTFLTGFNFFVGETSKTGEPGGVK